MSKIHGNAPIAPLCQPDLGAHSRNRSFSSFQSSDTSDALGKPARNKPTKGQKYRAQLNQRTEEIDALTRQLQTLKDRQFRSEEPLHLEINRLKREVEYHKRLRQGAEQRTYELEDQIRKERQQKFASIDEAQALLIEQTNLLMKQKAELQKKLQEAESEVSHQKSIVGDLEAQLYHVQAALMQALEHQYASQPALHEQDEGDYGEDDGSDSPSATEPDDTPEDTAEGPLLVGDVSLTQGLGTGSIGHEGEAVDSTPPDKPSMGSIENENATQNGQQQSNATDVQDVNEV